MIVYAYNFWNEVLSPDLFQHHLASMPKLTRNKILAYKRVEDRQNCLIGRLLLRHLLTHYFDQGQDCLSQLYKNKYGKLFINSHVDFNLSHSGNLVICAVSDDGLIGLDIEEKKHVQLEELSLFFREEELMAFKQTSKPSDLFYQIWTKKESLLKAMGRGLSIDLKDVFLAENYGYIKESPGDLWYLHALDIHSNYYVSLCTNQKDPLIKKAPFKLLQLEQSEP